MNLSCVAHGAELLGSTTQAEVTRCSPETSLEWVEELLTQARPICNPPLGRVVTESELALHRVNEGHMGGGGNNEGPDGAFCDHLNHLSLIFLGLYVSILHRSE